MRSTWTPAMRGPVEGLDHILVLQGVGLQLDQPPLCPVSDGRFPVDLLQQGLFQLPGRGQQLAVAAHWGAAAGQIVEQFGQVGADVGIAGDQAEIAVHPGRAGMVIAGADMGVAAQAVIVLADDKNQFAVGLHADHAVGDMDARLLQESGPADIGLIRRSGP